MKHARDDLNIWHLLARGGLITDSTQHDKSLLKFPNKNGWLPVHLAKDTKTAQWLYRESLSVGVLPNEITYTALLNNAESNQTKYGLDLMNVFQEQGFSREQSQKASLKPDFQSFIDLSYFWLSMADFYTFEENNPIEIAIANSNSAFFFALAKINHEGISSLIKRSRYKIGQSYFISDRAFQLQQLVKQNYELTIEISNNTLNADNIYTSDSLKNLEGF